MNLLLEVENKLVKANYPTLSFTLRAVDTADSLTRRRCDATRNTFI